jgi:hypothetical protein
MRPFYFALFLFVSLAAQAQYRINLQITAKADSIAYLRGVVFDDKNYFPKDTIRIAKKSVVLQSTKPIVGGIYYFQLDKSKKRHYFILENNDKLSLTIAGNDIQSSNPRNQIPSMRRKSQRVENSATAIKPHFSRIKPMH